MPDHVDHSQYQLGTYLTGMDGTLPTLPFTYPEWEAAGIAAMDDRAVGYVAGGAGMERTMAANTRAFDDWHLVPRVMRDVATRETRVELFGTQLPSPVMVAPIGVQAIIHPDGELATARAAASLDVPMIVSTAATNTMEDVAAASGDGPRWFQLYWPRDRAVTRSFLDRAAAVGYTAVVVTLDTKALAWRPRDLNTAYLPFLHQVGLDNWFTDPVWLEGLAEPVEANPTAAILHWAGTWSDPSLTWEDLAWLRQQTDLPILVKGVQHPADAAAAAEFGADGVIVSNHGGRQVDGAIGSLTALPGVVEAVGPEVPVLFDSGIRAGSDIAKALALGARAVLVGRPWCWGLALDGEAGVRHVLASLLAEFELTMALCGLNDVAQLDDSVLARA